MRWNERDGRDGLGWDGIGLDERDGLGWDGMEWNKMGEKR